MRHDPSPAHLDAVRSALLPLRLPGQIKLHWTDESKKRKEEIIAAVSRLDAIQVIITHRSEKSRKTERYRRKCLEQLYFELSDMQINEVTLESRHPTQNRKDIEHIVALQAGGQSTNIHLHHIRRGDEPLLWIPDIILGTINSLHSGTSRDWEKISDKVILNRSTPESLTD
ncbi:MULTISPECIES: hypothetical protein [unclassified Corynebacterium]|uniref:hypothetical protein n=1 Tax=unclassified Corynebacterium TaxID=2624378 RepID=UPI0029CA6D6C|nr:MULTISPECIES: hypothetical protein [unclassified Corynebacterium]WPF66330.1 hypothetical protein OLX12_00955 [Corynebacterium sp. 22KM0430]WPF68820.1 hypothetical protein OLW90_00955 [Corynebacterium sp. 21KM1197]